MAAFARRNPGRLALGTAVVEHDALGGHEARAPYDRIHPGTGVPCVPTTWVEPLAPGRRLLTTLATRTPSWLGQLLVTRPPAGAVEAVLRGRPRRYRPLLGYRWLSALDHHARIKAHPGSAHSTRLSLPPDEADSFWLAAAYLVPGTVRDLQAETMTVVAPEDDSWATAAPRTGRLPELAARPLVGEAARARRAPAGRRGGRGCARVTAELSRVDRARQALLAAREAAKQSCADRTAKPRRRTGTGVQRDGHEPFRFGAALTMMMTERGRVAHPHRRELRAMPPHAYLISTSRAAIVDRAALLRALREGWIAGAGLDVFDTELLPADDPLRRTLPNVPATPHLGYVTEGNSRTFYPGRRVHHCLSRRHLAPADLGRLTRVVSAVLFTWPHGRIRTARPSERRLARA